MVPPRAIRRAPAAPAAVRPTARTSTGEPAREAMVAQGPEGVTVINESGARFAERQIPPP